MSHEYKQGIEAGKKESTDEFDNPYDPIHETKKYNDWYRGFCYIRGAGDTIHG